MPVSVSTRARGDIARVTAPTGVAQTAAIVRAVAAPRAIILAAWPRTIMPAPPLLALALPSARVRRLLTGAVAGAAVGAGHALAADALVAGQAFALAALAVAEALVGALGIKVRQWAASFIVWPAEPCRSTSRR